MATGMDTNFGSRSEQVNNEGMINICQELDTFSTRLTAGESSSSNNSAGDNRLQDTTDSNILTHDTRVFVGSLPNKVNRVFYCNTCINVFFSTFITWQQLKSFFAKFGDVIYAKVFIDYITRRPKGHGFVRFSTMEAANRASSAKPKELKFFRRTLTVQSADAHFHRKIEKMSVQHLGLDLQDLEITEEAYALDPESPISKLNDDSLIHIFGYLAPVEKISVERVCKRWQRCALVAMRQQKELKLVKQMKSFGGFTDTHLYKMLHRSSWCLVSLDISSVSSQLNNRALEIISRYCTKIEKLNIAGVFVNNKGIEELTLRCRSIRWLCVFGCWNISEKGFWSIFKNCKNLEYLDCSGNSGFTGKCLLHAGTSFKNLFASMCQILMNEGILNLAKNCPQMETLDVTGCHQLTYQTISDLIKSLPCLKKINIADLPCHDGSHEPYQHVVQHFVNPGIITKLELYNSSLNDTGLQLICESCPLVSDLDISLNNLTDLSVTHISALTHLEYLSASHLYAITDESLKDVAMQGKLRRLHVQFCKGLTDKLMHLVAERCANIVEVDVAGIPSITINTLLAFHLRSLQQTPGSQVVIYTSYNNIDEDLVLNISPPFTLHRIESYRPLYPVKLRLEVELLEIEGFRLQDLQPEHAVLNNRMLPNLGLGGWRLCEDLIGSDDDSDCFDDYLPYDYLDNDDPLAEEYWNLS